MPVRCDKDGQEPGLATVKSTTKAMAFGNVLVGGAIGVVVDTTSGAAYDYPNVILVRMGTSSIVSTPTGAIMRSGPTAPRPSTRPWIAAGKWASQTAASMPTTTSWSGRADSGP